MSSQHQLTATGRLIVNALFAAAIFVGLGYVPATPYNTLAALLLMALVGSYTASISIPKPKPSTTKKSAGRQSTAGQRQMV